MPPCGSSTSPLPVMTSVTSLSATIIIASRLRKYLSVRQSLASSTAARSSWPLCRSSFASSRSNRVKASAVAPAKPPMTLPSWRRRTLRALGFITVWPIETCPSPMMTTLSAVRAERMVVPCQGAARCAVGSLMARDMGDALRGRKGRGKPALPSRRLFPTSRAMNAPNPPLRAAVVPVTAFQQNCTLLWCTETNKAAFVDPGGDLDKLKDAVRQTGVEIEKILITHGHMDHCGQAGVLARELGVPVEGPHEDDRFWIERLGEDGAR